MSLVETLTQEHRTLEELADALFKLAAERSKNFEPAAVVLFRAMYQHMVVEERGPFVTFRSSAPGLIEELMSDHKRLYHELGMQIRRAFDSGDNVKLVSTVRNLQDLLKANHRREERLLFPQLAKTAVR